MNRAIIHGFLLLPLLVGKVRAEDNSAAQANNPLANMTAFNIQDYYIGDLTESDKTANQGWLRFAKPVSVADTNWIVRASLPINTFPTAPDGNKETGTGDFNIFGAYLIDTGDPAVSFGIGPQLTAPTASKDELGSENGQLVLRMYCSMPVQQNSSTATC